MSEPVDRLPPALGVAPAAPASPPPTARESSPSFRALLDSLERLAKAPAPEAVHDPESLRAAVASAVDGFQLVMDLRRKLEEAWKQRAP